mmetsp:Transcript_38810/g.77330  ORF Transcript_38810/g.77330 Transcript_38810/m.77330 type:complete len:207 (-) Transcript_38810:402-1022(-)
MTRWDTGDRDAGREPCPDRIVEDLGGAFGMGAVGGFIWHFVKGARNSPQGDRWAGAMYSARSRAPILGGNFAVWGGTFSSFDCTLQYIRRRDDHWNAIASGFLTGGVLAARGGWKAASRNAVIGGVLLAIIEGVAALLMRSTSKTPREMALEQMEQAQQMEEYQKRKDAGEATGMSGWMQYMQASGMSPLGSGGGSSTNPPMASTS